MKEQPNFSYINQLSGDDLAFKAKLIDIIKTELPKEINQYLLHLNNHKYKLASNDVHKLKHKIIILGLELDYRLATAYESDLKVENTSKKNDFLKVLETMTNFIEKL